MSMRKRKVVCPDCRGIALERRWYDRKGLVEKDRKCKCGHHYNWSYGHVFINEKGDVE